MNEKCIFVLFNVQLKFSLNFVNGLHLKPLNIYYLHARKLFFLKNVLFYGKFFNKKHKIKITYLDTDL